MSLIKVARPALLCNGCRSAIIRSFTSVPAISPINRSQTSLQPIRQGRRSSTSRPKLPIEQDNQVVDDSLEEDPSLKFLEDEMEEKVLPESDSKPLEESPSAEETSTSPMPWYLQKSYQRPSTPTPDSLQNRQVIPPLPEHPPPLLQPLLEHISIQLGLDDLDLFDLRHLDPPPALGSKLIMIIGTARSEKHLHVSADRFCRWLRREHGLKANAAGLLGRNELKIKLRRKAKRMKMMANVGASMPEGQNLDDGIRTGWICCTIGRIPAHPEDTAVPGADIENFVGFRNVSSGVNVVVQMFTEEKRDEIDLETLWGGVLKTHDRQIKWADEELRQKEEKALEAQKEAQEEEILPTPAASPSHEPTASGRHSKPFPPNPRPGTGRFPSDPFPTAPTAGTGRQLRRLHTVGLNL